MKKDRKTYVDFVIGEIGKASAGDPIYVSDIAEALARYYSIDLKKAAAATSVAIKRVIDNGKVDGLRIFKKGIYYLVKKTPFGETGIDKEKLIFNKYLQNNEGYIGGFAALYQMGLTTQVPKTKEIVTNVAKECVRKDEFLGVSIRPPKVAITGENKEYLEILDAIELMGKAPIDVENPYGVLAQRITDKELRYDTMLALADKYYPRGTIYRLAHVASAGGDA